MINCFRPQYDQIINMLCEDLVERLDQMQEINVISCVRAFKYIPARRETHLLRSIQDMIQVTIEHNNENIKSNFLMDYLVESAELPNRLRLSRDKSEVLLAELNNRLHVQQIMQRRVHLDKLAKIASSFRYEPLLQNIKDTMQKVELRSTAICLILANNNVNINPLLDLVNGARMTKFQKVQYYLLMRYSNLEHNACMEGDEELIYNEIVQSLDQELPSYVDILSKQEVKSSLKKPLEDILLQKALENESLENHTARIP